MQLAERVFLHGKEIRKMEALTYKTNLVCSDTTFISLPQTASLLRKRELWKRNSTHPPAILKFLSYQQPLCKHYPVQIDTAVCPQIQENTTSDSGWSPS